MDFKKILVPMDFSDFSKKAAEFALSFGELYGADLTLLHVVTLFHEDTAELSNLQNIEEHVKMQEEAMHEELKAHADQFGHSEVQVNAITRRGFYEAEAILDTISDDDYDLVVMGTHGRKGLKHLVLGSIAEKVVRLSKVPVITIHDTGREFNLKRILVPVDFSSYSKKSIEYAQSLASRFDTDLSYLHVIENDVHPSLYAAGVNNIFEIDPELPGRANKKLQKFVGIPENGVSYEVIQGNVHKQICGFSEKMNADLIVMATRGLTGLDHILLGSTAERVVRLAKCPVMTVGR